MRNAFPLLSLPSNALKNVLSIMDTLDIISFSFVSNKTKSLVVPMKLKECLFKLNVSESFDVRLVAADSLIFRLCREWFNDPVPLRMDGIVKVEYRDEVYNWRKKGYGVRDWINHLMAVYNQSDVFMIEFEETGQRFELNSMKMTLQGLDIKLLSFFGLVPLSYIIDVVAVFRLKMFHVYFNNNPITVEFQSVLAQNFDVLQLLHMPFLGINELAVMNSKFVTIHIHELVPLRLINSFLKLWKTGTNRRLEFLFIFFRDRTIETVVNEIFKGIKHKVIPSTTVRHFKKPAGVDEPEKMVEVVGGYDIKGIDGRMATVRVEYDNCEMFFWSE